MDTRDAIRSLEGMIPDPSKGLPEGVFLFISRLTPMVNVDLLIKDEDGRTLLSWRDDEFHEPGWHVPGGIIRFKERWETRIGEVAEREIGAEVKFDTVPMAINQLIVDHDTRGHFISILFRCSLTKRRRLKNTGLAETDSGYLKWHDTCPANLIKVHEIYRKYI